MSEKNLAVFTATGFERATVTWFINAIRRSRKSRVRIDLGLCSHGDGVAFIAVYNPNKPVTSQALKPLVIHDVFINTKRGLCEDGKWCFNLKCPLNHAQLSYFRKHGIKTRGELEKIHKLFEKVKRDLKLENKPNFTVCYDKSPVYLASQR